MRTWQQLAVASVVVVATSLTPFARGQAPTYQIERIASGLRQPVYVDQAPGDPANILYYMTRVTTGGANAGSGTHGSIWRYNVDTRVSTEILNLSHRNLSLDLGPQGFTFHPDFNTPGAPGYQKIYVSSATTGGPQNFIEEYVASGPNGTVPVDGGSGEPIVNRLLLQYTNVSGQNNHVIDWIGFDPRAYSMPAGSPERNYLFISTGDGSNGLNATQRPEQKADIEQGKLLRIDVDDSKPDFYPGDPQKNFAIPDSNPIPLWNNHPSHGPNDQLVGTTRNYVGPAQSISYTPALPEIYFTGTRNSFRMSLDRATGDFYSGDVGENSREEVNFMPADPYDGTQTPYDFGFPQREGTANPISRSAGETFIQWDLSGGGSVIADSINPIQEGPHATFNSGSGDGDVEIRSSGRSAYIGGYVYRGPVAELQGKYFYSDFVQGNIFSLDFDANTPLGDFSGTNFNQVEVQPGIMAASLGTKEVVLNRNLNSLWHTIMVDPQDPTYTPALGSSFGIGRVVSFGEDNAGNLYIVDMGGVRGDVGFGNDYPGTDTGQIFRITPLVPPLEVTLSINRNTGEVTLVNSSGSPIDIDGYTIMSLNGSINPNEMIPITGNYDIPIPPGDGSIDNNNSWQITSSTNAQFGEETTGDEGTLATAAMVPLGDVGAWFQSIYEDWSLQIELPDGSTASGTVEFVGNGGQPFERSDLDFVDGIDPKDWDVFREHHGESFPGMSIAESYGLGDLNGDLVNDFLDYRIFQQDYIAANGAAAFAALPSVPEPAAGVLLISSAMLLLVRRKRFSRIRRFANPVASAVNWAGSWRVVTVAAVAIVAALHAVAARADLTHRYTFNDGTARDSVGSADGTLFGNAFVNDGVLDLPGAGNGITGDHLRLLANGSDGINIDSYTSATFEMWATARDTDTWSRYFDFGGKSLNNPSTGGNTIFLTPDASPAFTSMRVAISNVDINTQSGFDGEQLINVSTFTVPLSDLDEERHIVVTFNGSTDTMRLYFDGQDVGSNLNATHMLQQLQDDYALVGASLYDNDPSFNGTFNEFRVYDHALSAGEVQANFIAGPTPEAVLGIEVDTFTGAVTIRNDNPDPFSFDYYKIASPAGALNPATWNSLDDQDIGFGSGTGESWDETGSPDSNQVIELFLLGATTMQPDTTLSLGNLFDPLVFGKRQDGDVEFDYAPQGGGLLEGTVAYLTPPPLPGDYNDDGKVNAADYTVYRNHMGEAYQLANEVDGVTPGMVTPEDYDAWKVRYGDMLGTGSGAASQSNEVPEPASAVLLVMACLLPLTLRA